MEIRVSNEILLTEIRATDKSAYIEHMKVKEISERTLRIPYPYTDMDADEWLKLVRYQREDLSETITFAIRNQENFLIGGIGFDDFVPRRDHKAELGFWLAKPYWGKGIMTAVVGKLVDHAFKQFNLVRISANIMVFNVASCRVVEKCGFTLEGLAKGYYRKNGELIDAKLYARVR